MNNYYFTSDRWYGPVDRNYMPDFRDFDQGAHYKEALIAYLDSLPSGPIAPELSKWAGMVKEEGKDFGFEYTCNRRLDFCYCPKRCLDILQTAIPIAEGFEFLIEREKNIPEETKAAVKKLMDELETDNKDQQKQMIREADTILSYLKKDKNHISHLLNKDEETSYNTGFFAGFKAATEYLKTKP